MARYRQTGSRQRGRLTKGGHWMSKSNRYLVIILRLGSTRRYCLTDLVAVSCSVPLPLTYISQILDRNMVTCTAEMENKKGCTFDTHYWLQTARFPCCQTVCHTWKETVLFKGNFGNKEVLVTRPRLVYESRPDWPYE
jgi:hypothetical protein